MTDPLCINDRTVEICRVENRREERPAADAAAPMPWADAANGSDAEAVVLEGAP